MSREPAEPYKIFEFGRIDLTQDDIAKFAPWHLQFVGQSCLAANDISIFLKFLLGHFHKEGPNEIIEQLGTLTRIIIQRQLQSKLFEYVKLMDDYHKVCVKKKDNIIGDLLDEIQICTSELKKDRCYELARFTRNKVTNHYAFQDWHNGAKKHKKSHKFTLYMHKMNGNTFYPFAEEASHLSFLGEEEWNHVSFQEIFEWMLNANRTLVDLQQRLLIVIFEHYVTNFRLKSKLVFVPDRLVFDEETRFPLLSLLDGSGRW